MKTDTEKKKPTIAIVYNTSWYIYNFRINLMKRFKKEGYRVVAIAPKDDYSNKLLENGFDAYYEIKMNNKGMNPLEDLKTIYEMYKIYKAVKPDIICQYTIKPNIYGTIAASFLNIPTINNIAGLGTLFSVDNLMTKFAKQLYKFSQSKATKIFFQNKDDMGMFIEENIVEKSKCDLLPGSGVDLVRFKPVATQTNDEMMKFLLISRMIWEKGIGEYVDASRIIKTKYKNIEFQLLGGLGVDNRSAISKEQMQDWVEEGLVNYLGTTDNVVEYIEKADCIVLPSFYREGTPRTLLEAASMAKPIITTDNVGCRDVVDNGINGYCVQVKDADDLAEKIEMMIHLSEKDRIEMGKKGRDKMIAEYDENIVLTKYVNAVQEIL